MELRKSIGIDIKDNSLNTTICPHYPSLEKDTICFYPACRQAHTQIFCSYCEKKQKLHHSHILELLPIHMTSKVFRLLDSTYSQTNEHVLAANIDEGNQAVKDLHTIFQSQVEQIASKYFSKIQCLSDFLSQDATFKVCDKMRHKSSQHQNCCIEIVNDLKNLEDSGRVTDNSVEEIVLREAAKQKKRFKEYIDCISAQIKVFFSQFKQNQLFIQHKSQDDRKAFHDEIDLPLKQQKLEQSIEQFDKESMESIVSNGVQTIKRQSQFSNYNQFNQEHCQFFNGTSINLVSPNLFVPDEEQKHESRPLSIIKQLLDCNDQKFSLKKEQQHFNDDDGKDSRNRIKANSTNGVIKSIPPKKNQEKKLRFQISFEKKKILLDNTQQNQQKIESTYLKGFEFTTSETLRIWKMYRQESIPRLFKILTTFQQVKHVVIESTKLSSIIKIKEILNCMSWLEGLHLHCSYGQNKHKEKLQLKQFSLLPTYRFLRLIDKSKYFMCTNTTISKRKRLIKMTKIKQQPFYGKMYIYSNTHPNIPESIEELQFFSTYKELTLCKDIFKIRSPNLLKILSFLNVSFDTKASLKHIFTDCSLLNTLVFEDCIADHNEIAIQFKYLRVFQMKHLQISCDWLDKNCILKSDALEQIFRLQSLQTLILTKITFVENQRQDKVRDSSMLRSISKLRELSYLNLYSSEPVFNDLLTYINKDCHKKMEMINIGCSQVTKGVGKLLQKFINLKSLCVDYTSIDENQLLQATNEMKQLRFLSIQNLNGSPVVYEETEKNGYRNTYGNITPSFFSQMRYKNLQYVNICNCDALKEYEWKQFPQIQCIRINNGFFSGSLLNLFRTKGVNVFSDLASINYQNENDSQREGNEKHQSIVTYQQIENDKAKSKQKQQGEITEAEQEKRF